MYVLLVTNFNETDIACTATNLKSLKWGLTELQNRGDLLLADKALKYEIEKKLPNYKDLLKIFKKRNLTNRICYRFTWLDSFDSSVEIQITFIKENYSFECI